MTNPVALEAWYEGVIILDQEGSDGSVRWLSERGITTSIASDIEQPLDLALDRSGSIYVLAGLNPTERHICVAKRQDASSRVNADQFDEPAVLVKADEFIAAHTSESLAPTSLEADHPGEVFIGIDSVAERPIFRRRPDTDQFERLDGELAAVSGLTHHAENDGRVYTISDDSTRISSLVGMHGHYRNPETDHYDARLVRRLDSGIARCQWHRLTIGYDQAGGPTAVRVRYYATDGPAEEIGVEAISGIGPVFGDRLRGAGAGTLQSLSALDSTTVASYASTEAFTVPQSWGETWIEQAEEILDEGDHVNWRYLDVTNPSDILLPAVEGRYLWLRIELIGGRFDSPILDSVRAYFPRRSYLRYLPDVYEQEDTHGVLEAYLSTFESIVLEISEAIEESMGYLHPDGIPSGSVDWLTGWFGLETDETWSTRSRRDLIRWAPLLARYRGTRAGLLATIWLYLRKAPAEPDHWDWARQREREWITARRDAGDIAHDEAEALLDVIGQALFILEHADLDCIESAAARAPFERIVPCEQCFGVFTTPSLPNDSLQVIERIVRAQQPVHTTGRTIRLQPWIQLAGDEATATHRTFLGINSALAEREYVLESAELGTDAVVTAIEPDGQLGRRGRLGTDTKIS